MNSTYWKQSWERNQISFHQSKPNSLFLAYFKELNLANNSRVFIPLCGKTLEIAWLLSKGFRVTGAELSELAIEQLFMELGLEPKLTEYGRILRYSAKNIDIFVGDIFDLSSDILGSVDAIYDRAALVALPEEIRIKYTKHLVQITDGAQQLLITFEYDQRLMGGPPFSLGSDKINQYYKSAYNVVSLGSIPASGMLKGICAAAESIWLLRND